MTARQELKALAVAAIDAAASEQIQSLWRIYWSSFLSPKNADERFEKGLVSVQTARRKALELVAGQYGRD